MFVEGERRGLLGPQEMSNGQLLGPFKGQPRPLAPRPAPVGPAAGWRCGRDSPGVLRVVPGLTSATQPAARRRRRPRRRGPGTTSLRVAPGECPRGRLLSHRIPGIPLRPGGRRAPGARRHRPAPPRWTGPAALPPESDSRPLETRALKRPAAPCSPEATAPSTLPGPKVAPIK
ncbi:basic proline-rich protein-like isoform X1 [Cavia porcellus]|uniref:basic proline-rich protein-like isoform X1 n=1 Tax=Cavia porcellus TaxID=10141 RepID=UPI002FE1FE94